jgi:hypothetical protein
MRARLVIPVFRNLFLDGKNVPARIPEDFFPVFSGGIFHRNVVLERLQEFLFFFAATGTGIFLRNSYGQEFLYLPRIPPDSSGFLFPPSAVQLRPATKEGSLVSKLWNKIDLFTLPPKQDLTMVAAAPVLCWCLLA